MFFIGKVLDVQHYTQTNSPGRGIQTPPPFQYE